VLVHRNASLGSQSHVVALSLEQSCPRESATIRLQKPSKTLMHSNTHAW